MYVSTYYYVSCPHTSTTYVSSYYYSGDIRLDSTGTYTSIYVSSYFYIRVLILLYTCPHTSTFVSSHYLRVLYYYMCPHTTTHVSSGDIRLDCTDTLADAGSNGGLANRFWGSDLKKVDACGPHSACADKV